LNQCISNLIKILKEKAFEKFSIQFLQFIFLDNCNRMIILEAMTPKIQNSAGIRGGPVKA
jgi:hypothetical protein